MSCRTAEAAAEATATGSAGNDDNSYTYDGGNDDNSYTYDGRLYMYIYIYLCYIYI
jgi:hypothetical protein